MNTVESLGYLKGLLEGLDIDNKNGKKIYNAIVEVLENIVDDINEVYEEIDSVEEQMDAIDEDLAAVEDYLDEECCCDEDCCCDDECCCEDEYELECPACGETIVVDGETVAEGGLECPACGEYLEFDLDGDDEDEE